jgi:hypothetical protein
MYRKYRKKYRKVKVGRPASTHFLGGTEDQEHAQECKNHAISPLIGMYMCIDLTSMLLYFQIIQMERPYLSDIKDLV